MNSEEIRRLITLVESASKISVVIAPSRETVNEFVKMHEMVRFLISDDKNLYMWDASEANHKQVAMQYNLSGALRLLYVNNIMKIRSVDTDEEEIDETQIREALNHPFLIDVVKMARDIVVED